MAKGARSGPRRYGRQEREEDGSEGARAEAGGPEQGNAVTEWIKSLVIAAVLFLVLKAFLIQTFVITSGSMENTLLVGDFLVVNRLALGSPVPFTGIRIPGYSAPHRWDVIVFDPPHEEGMKLVKRLVGMPGDTLAMKDQVLYVNGKAQDEPWVHATDIPDDAAPEMAWQRDYLAPGVDPSTYHPTRDDWGPLVVPPDRYFMMGDNRENSYDSRYWGMLERWRLDGRAEVIYFSYDKESYKPFPWIREIRWGRIGDGIH